ncbi:hypothetical protein ACFQH2_16975 [Natronoarchaeum sp. GCM10025703]
MVEVSFDCYDIATQYHGSGDGQRKAVAHDIGLGTIGPAASG